MKELRETLPFKFRVQQFGYDKLAKKNTVVCVAYVDPRVLQDKLDDIFGFDGWKSEYYSVNNSTYCKLSIWSINRNDWVIKSDSGETQRDKLLMEYNHLIKDPNSSVQFFKEYKDNHNKMKKDDKYFNEITDTEFDLYQKKIKSLNGELEHISKTEATDAFKRACVQLGLGRFLYSMSFLTLYVDGNYLVDENGNEIKDNQNKKIYKGSPDSISEYCNSICNLPESLISELREAVTLDQLTNIHAKMYNLRNNETFLGYLKKKKIHLEEKALK